MLLKVDFSIAVAVYLAIMLGVVFCLWILIRRQEFFADSLSEGPKFIWCCSICTYTYFTTHKTEISTCPRCASYNKMQPKREPEDRSV